MVAVSTRELTEAERAELRERCEVVVRPEYRCGCLLYAFLIGLVMGVGPGQWLADLLERWGVIDGSGWLRVLLLTCGATGLLGVAAARGVCRFLARDRQRLLRLQAAHGLAAGLKHVWHVRAEGVNAIPGDLEPGLWVFAVGPGELLVLSGAAQGLGEAVSQGTWPVDAFTLECWPDGSVERVLDRGQPLATGEWVTECELNDSRLLEDYYAHWPMFAQPRVIPGTLATWLADLSAWAEAWEGSAARQSWGGEVGPVAERRQQAD